MHQFLNSIKLGVTSPAYLLYGDEPLLMDEALALLCDLLAPGDDPWNKEVFDGEETSVDKIIIAASQSSFFGNKKLVIVKNLPLLQRRDKAKAEDKPKEEKSAKKSSINTEEVALLDYLADPNPDCCLVFTCRGFVDKRRKVITAIVKAGRIVEFPIPRTEEKNAWLKAYLAKQGKMADNAVINQLTFVAGQNLALLKQEADKICLYTGGRQKIEQADIEAVVSKNSISSIFSLLDAVAEQKATLALNLYREMLRQGEAPQMILAMLSGQFHNILAVQDLRREEHKPGDIAKILGLHPFAVEKCLRFANRYSVPKGIKSLEILLAADIAQKTGTGDMTELLETAILRICSF